MIKFEITQAHIDAANEWLAHFLREFRAQAPNSTYAGVSWRRTCNCPTARALLDHFGLNLGEVTATVICVWNETETGGEYENSDDLRHQIMQWDRTGKFEPGTYEITPIT